MDRSYRSVVPSAQYPYRNIQIVLRLYNSPGEILAGFDVDAPCCAYDGDRVWANPRAIVSMMRQSNTVDMTRRSPSYEVRLAKYALRGFEVYVPGLKRDEIDPTVRPVRYFIPNSPDVLAPRFTSARWVGFKALLGCLHSRSSLLQRLAASINVGVGCYVISQSLVAHHTFQLLPGSVGITVTSRQTPCLVG